MTIRSFWVKVFITGLVTLAVVLVVLAVWLADTRKNLGESRHATEIQSGELRDLNLLLTRKDEEIISLKKKLSMSTIYQSLPDTEEPAATPAVSNVPMDHPPFAGIKELFMTGSSLSFRIENVRPSGQGAARGHLFIVFRKQDSEICYPAADIVNGIPAETKKGLPFAIRYFKPMNVPVPPAMSDWESITFHIFDEQGKMRLSMPLDRKQIQ